MTKRNTNIELLRILAMAGILAHHFVVHGGFHFSTGDVSLNLEWLHFLQLLGKLGVNIFILITGYYTVPNHENTYCLKKDTQKSIRRVVAVEFGVLFWSVLLNGLETFLMIQKGQGSLMLQAPRFIVSFFPLLSTRWWFATDWCLLMLLAPCINFSLNNLETRKYRALLVCLLIPCSVIPTIVYFLSPVTDGLPHLIVLYCLGGYLKRVGQSSPPRSSLWMYGLCATISVAIIFFTTVVCDSLGRSYQTFSTLSTHLFQMYTTPMILLSTSVFMCFVCLKPTYNRYINRISAATFGVYLIHDSDFGRDFFWNKLFHNSAWQNSDFLVAYSLFAIAGTFIICILAEMIRLRLFAGIQNKILNRVENMLNEV